MSSGTGSFRKKGRGYEYRIWMTMPDGSRKQKSFTGPTKTACRQKYERALQNTNEIITRGPSLGSFAAQWIELKQDTVSYRTWKNYHNYLENYVLPNLDPSRPLTAIKPMDIQKMMASCSHLSDSTRSDILLTAKQMFRCALDNDYIQKDPCKNIRIHKTDEIKELTVYTPEEITIIESHLRREPIGVGIALMLIPAALGILPGFLFGTIVDALSGIIPGFSLGTLIDALAGACFGSPIGAFITAIGGAILGGIIGGLINPGKWIGVLLGSIPGAVSGGAIGNVLGRILGVIALPGKWLFGHIGRRIGQLLGLIPGAIEGLFILPGKYLGAAIGGFLGDLMQPMQNAVPALAGACDCGCNMVDCTCNDGDCNCNEETAATEVPNAGASIAALRQQMMAVPNNTSVPQTGDKGVMACGTIALISWLILMWLVGAKKKEEL